MRKRTKTLISSCLAAMLITTNMFLPVSKPVTASAAGPSFTSVGGYLESIYAQISGVKDSDVTGVSYSGAMSGSLTGQDLEFLVRDENGGVRIDIPGLKAGTYSLEVTTKSGNITQSNIEVAANDRSGYAHFNYTNGVGAYKDDGTLKDNAIVIYVTNENKNTVTVRSKDGTTVSGIGNILNSAGGKIRTDVKNPNKVLSKTDEGLKIHIKSASPFVVGWKQIQADTPEPGDNGGNDNDGNDDGDDEVLVAQEPTTAQQETKPAPAVTTPATAESTKQEASGAATGDNAAQRIPALMIISLISAIAATAALSDKRRRNR